MRPLDSPALAAGTAPGVADSAQPVAAEIGDVLPKPHRSHRDVMGHEAIVA